MGLYSAKRPKLKHDRAQSMIEPTHTETAIWHSPFCLLRVVTHTETERERQRELQFRSLTMEAPPFSSSCSSSSLSSTARLLSSPSPSSSLLFRRNSFSKTHYSAKFKSPRNLSVRASGDSGTLSLSLSISHKLILSFLIIV